MLAWFGFGVVIVGLIGLFIVGTNWSIGDGWMLASIITMFVGILIMCIGLVISEEEEKSACESIGGRYVVVDTQMTVVSTGKVTTASEIDIYGCVKE